MKRITKCITARGPNFAGAAGRMITGRRLANGYAKIAGPLATRMNCAFQFPFGKANEKDKSCDVGNWEGRQYLRRVKMNPNLKLRRLQVNRKKKI